jgi:RNA polymerase sigma-70 factor (ECF subfamily)
LRFPDFPFWGFWPKGNRLQAKTNAGMRELTSSQSKPGSPTDTDTDTDTGQVAEATGGGDSRIVRMAIARAQKGDMEALHFLYVRYAADVLRYVRSFVGDHHEAEDITQNVFVKLMSVIGKYEPREVPFAALDHLRARRMTPCEDVRVQDDEHDQISHERGRDLRHALEGLPEEQREVLVLRHIVGLSPVEIADVLGKTESSVHGLHHRGRLSLQSALEELGAAPVVAPSRA